MLDTIYFRCLILAKLSRILGLRGQPVEHVDSSKLNRKHFANLTVSFKVELRRSELSQKNVRR